MQDFGKGVARAVGVIVGFLPIAMSFGAIAIQAGISPWETMGMSIGIFGGASQFAAVEAMRQNLPWFSVVLTVWVLNLRHIPMSLAIQKNYSQFSQWQRWVLLHGLVDETFALEMSEQPRSFSFYLGMHLACWVAWNAGTWAGFQMGMILPERWLQFALPALFIYLLVDNLRRLWSRAIPIILAIGIALTLVTQSLGATGILLSIMGVAIAASLILNTKTLTQDQVEELQ